MFRPVMAPLSEGALDGATDGGRYGFGHRGDIRWYYRRRGVMPFY